MTPFFAEFIGTMLLLLMGGGVVANLAPRFMHMILPIKGKGSSYWEYAWIPGIAPLAGSALAAMLYYVLK